MKKPYLIISALIVLFAAPGLGAYLLFKNPHWLKNSTNHGQLLPVPQALSALSQSKWQLIYWYPGVCDASCVRHMNDLARVRLSLGRRAREVGIVLLANHAAISDALRMQLDTEGGEFVLVTDSADEVILGNKPAFYIANPQHYLILRYKETLSLEDIFQDLKQLVHEI